MARYSERAEQCQEMARERKKSQKAPRKKNVKVAKGDDNEGDSNDIAASNHDDVSVANDNVTSTYDNVESVADDVSL